MKKKLFSLLSMILCLSMLLPAVGAYADNGFTLSLPTETEYGSDEDLLAGYMLKQMYGDISPFALGNCEDALKDQRNKDIYNYLKNEISKIAASGGSSSIEIPRSVFGDISFDASKVSDPQAEFQKVFAEAVQIHLIIECLLYDCPYELYWYDKSAGASMSVSPTQQGTIVSVNSINIRFRVIPAYQAKGYGSNSPAVTTDVTRISNAVANAKSVVLANADKSDTEKLTAYKEYICNAVAYDHSAPGTAYGDPWQLINVFDGNSSTNIVCEGYSKAFAFLCELTEFEGDVTVYIVTGSTGEGHMWNVVDMNSGIYIADLTNSDSGSIGQGGQLFMNASPDASSDYGYIFKIGSQSITYTYDSATIELYGTDAIRLGLKAVLGVEAKGNIPYTVSGNTVTVTHSLACKVGYFDGDKYVAVAATPNSDGSYSFTVPTGVTEVLLVVKGDISGDGVITNVDVTRTKLALLGKRTATDAELFAADVVNGNEILTNADVSRIKLHFLGKRSLEW